MKLMVGSHAKDDDDDEDEDDVQRAPLFLS